jgi:hypothetical protein
MTLRHTLSASCLASALLALSAAPAAADVLPMDVTECDMHTVGSTCTDPAGGGVCTMSTCTRIDYAHWDRDASASPPSMVYDCVRCIVDGRSDSGTVPSDASTVSADAGSAPAPTASCSASRAGTDGAWWLAVLAITAPLWLSRRRR